MNHSDFMKLAQELASEHGVTVPLTWDNGRKRAGAAHHIKIRATNTVVPVRVTFSKILVPLFTDEAARDLILHEFAHVLADGADHSWAWKQKCLEIGADPSRCYENGSFLPDAQKPKAPWVGTCPKCGKKSSRFKQPVRVSGCPNHYGGWRKDQVLTWEYNGRPVPLSQMHPRFQTEHRSIFGSGEVAAAGTLTQTQPPVTRHRLSTARRGDTIEVVYPQGRHVRKGQRFVVEAVGSKNYRVAGYYIPKDWCEVVTGS